MATGEMTASTVSCHFAVKSVSQRQSSMEGSVISPSLRAAARPVIF
jgi:hypothetical protein